LPLGQALIDIGLILGLIQFFTTGVPPQKLLLASKVVKSDQKSSCYSLTKFSL